uniref:Uncharacterized protein n=1 Tax=Apiospora rasikravindrae TaxID=990691 RepID=A0ABR1T0I5_9PEZI
MSSLPVKQEPAVTQEPRSMIKSEDDGQEHRSWNTIAEFKGNQSTGEADDTIIKTEEQGNQGRNPSQSVVERAGFDWENSIQAIKSQARSHGIMELPTDEIGRVMMDGTLIGIHHVFFSRDEDCLVFNREKDFFVCDGVEVLARISNPQMKKVIFKIALHHVARLLNCAHPHDLILDINAPSLEYTMTYIGGGGWALRCFPTFDQLGD